jgi:hypothetical protein
MLRSRAMRLLERPWLIIARISRSRAVSVSQTRQLDCAERPYAERASHPEGRLSGKGRTSQCVDSGASVPAIMAALLGAGLIGLFLAVEDKDWLVGYFLASCVCSPHWSSPSPRTPRGIAASLCSAHELHYAEPPSNRSSVERNLTEICVLARALAELVTPPAMRHHAKTSATAITDQKFAVLSHDTLVLGVDTCRWSTGSGILQ